MNSWQSMLITVAISLVSIGAVTALGFLANYLRKLAATKAWAAAMAKLVEILKSSIEHAISELKPEILKAYEDGSMSAEEWAGIKAKIIALAKTSVKDGLKEIMKAIGIQGGAFEVFLSGMIEQLVKEPPKAVVAMLPK